MITYAQAALLGILQGVTELFPISSLGHSVLVPQLLGWNIDLSDPKFVAFVILTHLATALVLLGFFWRDWLWIIAGIFRSLRNREIEQSDTYARLGWLIVVSTIPAGVLGLLFQNAIQQLFAQSSLVAIALIINGCVLYIAERLRRTAGSSPAETADDAHIAQLTWTRAVVIGFAQSFALIPGFSRTGMSMTSGLWSGLSHENAARYSFLLATPIIFAAAILKVPDLFSSGDTILGQALCGAVCAALAAYVSVRFLVKYFQTKTLTPFSIYCIAAGVLALLVFAH